MYRRLAILFFSEFRPESFPGQAGDCAAVHRVGSTGPAMTVDGYVGTHD